MERQRGHDNIKKWFITYAWRGKTGYAWQTIFQNLKSYISRLIAILQLFYVYICW